jgi:hypothetical protein
MRARMCNLTLALSGRAMSAAARQERMLARRARGAHAMTVHGPLERVVRQHAFTSNWSGVVRWWKAQRFLSKLILGNLVSCEYCLCLFRPFGRHPKEPCMVSNKTATHDLTRDAVLVQVRRCKRSRTHAVKFANAYPISRRHECCLTLALSGRALSAAARRGCMMYLGARGAHATMHDGPLERVVR